MCKDAVVWVCNILKHECEVHRKVPNEVVTGPAWLVQFWQPCSQQINSHLKELRPKTTAPLVLMRSTWVGWVIGLVLLLRS